ncbi:MAG: coat protein [Cressdnaviricota sp.]|nr:MAG: coat protein [Cressdnaviricota sp.]
MVKTRLTAIVKKPRKQKPKNYKLTKVAKDLIAKQIDPKIENKQLLYHLRPTSFNNAIAALGDFNRVLPEFQQGVARDDRVGSQIRLKSIVVRGWITIPSNDQIGSADRAGICCRLMCLSSKKTPNWETLQADIPNLYLKLLRNGSVENEYDGTIQNHLMPTNTAVVTKHYDRSFQMNRGQIIGNAGHQPNITKPFSFKVACKNKVLKFGAPGEVDPANFCPFIVLGFTYTNNAAPSIQTVPLMTYTSTVTYED